MELEANLPGRTLREKKLDKRSEIIGLFEEIIDRRDLKFNTYQFLREKIKSAVYGVMIADYYKPLLAELKLIGVDPQVTEGYSWMTAKQVTTYVTLVETIIADALRFTNNTKAASASKNIVKYQTRTAVALQKKLSKLKYCKDYLPLKLQSIDPASIIGKTALWLYDTKYSRLIVLRAEEGKTLDFKGTTILNYDEKTSITKRIGRNKEQVIADVLGSSKISLRKIMSTIKTDAVQSTGRLSENVVLLKVEK